MNTAFSPSSITATAQSPTHFDPMRTIEYFGVVNYGTNERVIEEIRALYQEDPGAEIILAVTSAGGPSGTAMSFHDHMRYVLKPKLVTIGSGDVDSSGVIILLSGSRKYVTKNTTLLLHLAGRVFDGNQRYTAKEIDAMLREDRLKDFQYASIVAESSNGLLTTEKVLELMERNTILTPVDLMAYGLVDAVLE
ncbi:MAG TPA: ATP-dependent Clp protease proteolytic subunit [Candidatus Paceibacterota bacterium]|nr:ATP-dependent Clp protease proteolytic subunit [Candidatus Paceibacterota bacterium]